MTHISPRTTIVVHFILTFAPRPLSQVTPPSAKKRKALKNKTEEAFDAEDYHSEALKKLKADKKLKTLELLSYKHIQVGTKLLGAVREVRHFGLTVSLPNQLNGVVMYQEVSDTLFGLANKAGDMLDDEVIASFFSENAPPERTTRTHRRVIPSLPSPCRLSKTHQYHLVTY